MKNKNIHLSFRVSKDLADMIDELHRRTGLSKSEILRLAIYHISELEMNDIVAALEQEVRYKLTGRRHK